MSGCFVFWVLLHLSTSMVFIFSSRINGAGKPWFHILASVSRLSSNPHGLQAVCSCWWCLFLTGGYYVQDNLRRMLINVRKGWSLLLLYLLASLLLPFVNNSNNFENWVMAMIPMAAFHGCTYLYSTLRIYPNLVFWLSVAFVLAYQYAGPGWAG